MVSPATWTAGLRKNKHGFARPKKSSVVHRARGSRTWVSKAQGKNLSSHRTSEMGQQVLRNQATLRSGAAGRKPLGPRLGQSPRLTCSPHPILLQSADIRPLPAALPSQPAEHCIPSSQASLSPPGRHQAEVSLPHLNRGGHTSLQNCRTPRNWETLQLFPMNLSCSLPFLGALHSTQQALCKYSAGWLSGKRLYSALVYFPRGPEQRTKALSTRALGAGAACWLPSRARPGARGAQIMVPGVLPAHCF